METTIISVRFVEYGREGQRDRQGQRETQRETQIHILYLV